MRSELPPLAPGCVRRMGPAPPRTPWKSCSALRREKARRQDPSRDCRPSVGALRFRAVLRSTASHATATNAPVRPPTPRPPISPTAPQGTLPAMAPAAAPAPAASSSASTSGFGHQAEQGPSSPDRPPNGHGNGHRADTPAEDLPDRLHQVNPQRPAHQHAEDQHQSGVRHDRDGESGAGRAGDHLLRPRQGEFVLPVLARPAPAPRARQLHVPGQAGKGEKADDPVARVGLPPAQAVPGRGRKCMVGVVEALAQGQDAEQVIVAALVAAAVGPKTP